MTKKVLSIIIAILILIIVVATYSTIIHHNQKKKVQEFLDYTNSTEKGGELITPNYLHVVLGVYKGEASGLNILKSINYFTNNIVPEIHKKCGNIITSRLYYNNHKTQLQKQIGIDNFDDFYEIVKKCELMNDEEYTIEKIEFDKDSLNKDKDGVTASFRVKYINSGEIEFNVKVLNSVYSDRTSVNIK